MRLRQSKDFDGKKASPNGHQSVAYENLFLFGEPESPYGNTDEYSVPIRDMVVKAALQIRAVMSDKDAISRSSIGFVSICFTSVSCMF